MGEGVGAFGVKEFSIVGEEGGLEKEGKNVGGAVVVRTDGRIDSSLEKEGATDGITSIGGTSLDCDDVGFDITDVCDGT